MPAGHTGLPHSITGSYRKPFHDLRHSCASLLLAQGVAPRVVMETLGHSRIAITLDTYTHVLPALQRDAADAMDRALRMTLAGLAIIFVGAVVVPR